MERATVLESWRAKKLSGLIANTTAAQGNAATLGVGRRVEESAIGLNLLLYMAAPYEEMRLKKP